MFLQALGKHGGCPLVVPQVRTRGKCRGVSYQVDTRLLDRVAVRRGATLKSGVNRAFPALAALTQLTFRFGAGVWFFYRL